MLYPLGSSDAVLLALISVYLPRELGGVGAGATLVRAKGQVSVGTQVSISSGLWIVQGDEGEGRNIDGWRVVLKGGGSLSRICVLQ